jgi:Coenzyme PQQ synthesis protein D (PqqD)
MKKVNLLDINSSMLKDLEVVAAKDQISRDLDGEAVILNMKSGVYCGLNEVGARIWQLVQKTIDIEQICETLLAEYNVEKERCENEVLALLQQMAAKGLIEIKNGKNS